MNRKDKYREFCTNHFVPLYIQPYWLDSVCGAANWDVCLVFEQQGELIGALPYHMMSKYGFHIIKMPVLTDYVGFVYNFDNHKNAKLYRQEALKQQTVEALIAQLPNTHLFYQQYDTSFDNWLPFYWKGFRQTTMYTYVLTDLSNLNAIFNNFKATVRTNIRKAEQLVYVELSDRLIELYQVNVASFAKQNTSPPYSFEALQKLDFVLKEKGKRCIYLAKDKITDEPHAGLYVAWDEQTAYFMLWGVDSKFSDSRALQLLFWRAIQDFSVLTQRIDFCGSVIPSIERTLRAFGAERKPCFCIFKTKNKFLQIMSLLLNKAYV